MTITTHVTSVELSLKLRDLKIKKKPYFHWVLSKKGWKLHYGITPKQLLRMEFVGNEVVPAYLASELDQLIARATNGEYAFITNEELTMGYRVYEPIMESEGLKLIRTGYKLEVIESAGIMDENLVDCRAKCLIYLIENHLISVEELGK